jgi:UDP-N-acetylmuramate dehydrogenase
MAKLNFYSGDLQRILDKQKILSGIERSENFLFSENTTYRLGGGVRMAYFPKNIIEAKILFKEILKRKDKFVVVGNGSNILASNKFFDGVVISTKKLKGIVRVDKNTIFCLAGTSVGELLSYCKNKSLGGLEYLYGIPATIGGLCYMNGGAGGFYISNNVKTVKLCCNKIVNLPSEKCNFSNKYSTMRDIISVILGIFLQIEPKTTNEIEKRIAYFKEKRALQPKGKSCGCVFKNVGDVPSGKIIDELGLKGKRIGGAYVSTLHANFILNDGTNPDDVKALIEYIKSIAFLKRGITLQEEVIYFNF